MNRNTETGTASDEVLSSPSLLFLYYRIEQILGIRANPGALTALNEYLERTCGGTFIEKPGAYEKLLTSREKIFEISKIVTINETYFFREGLHFKLLVRHFLPQLAKLGRPIRICSAASSIGCEAYSIAMVLDYYRKKNDEGCSSLEFEIDAFDVSAEAVETAKRACYTSNTLRTDGADWKYILDSYIVPNGSEFIVSHEIREKVRFFPHNIMRGFEKKYDIIFFRNAMIYFSNRNRLIIMDSIADALYSDGILLLGVSETSSVRHPLLVNRYLSDVFFFQKTGNRHSGESEILKEARNSAPPPVKTESVTPNLHQEASLRAEASLQTEALSSAAHSHPRRHKGDELPVDCGKVAAILEQEEGAANAKKILAAQADGQDEAGGSELAAAVVHFLSTGDADSADPVLSRLEKHSSAAVTRFLRGEYYFLRGNTAEAEKKFDEAAGQDRAFWPAFYRLSSFAADGNRVSYEYKLKKALESLELGKDKHYECFFGGFSPDYFRQIIEKKLG